MTLRISFIIINYLQEYIWTTERLLISFVACMWVCWLSPALVHDRSRSQVSGWCLAGGKCSWWMVPPSPAASLTRSSHKILNICIRKVFCQSLSSAQLPPQPDEGWTEGKFGHQSTTLEPSLNLLTQSELFFSLFLFFPFIKALNLLFNIVSPPADRGRVYSTGLFEWCCLEVDGVCGRGQ